MSPMGGVTSGFRELEARIRILRKKFLSRQLSDERNNPLTFEPDLERLAAFRLLAHAEIEDYLEQKAKDMVVNLKVEIKSGYKIAHRLDWFVLAQKFKKDLPIGCPHDLVKFNVTADQILSEGLSFISDNNGIKANSFLTLSLLSGKRVIELDDSLAASLTAFGSDRGKVAHKSVTRITTINAPSAEEATVASLLKDLRRYFYGK